MFSPEGPEGNSWAGGGRSFLETRSADPVTRLSPVNTPKLNFRTDRYPREAYDCWPSKGLPHALACCSLALPTLSWGWAGLYLYAEPSTSSIYKPRLPPNRPCSPPWQAPDPLDELRPVAARINALFPTWEAVMRVPAGGGGAAGALESSRQNVHGGHRSAGSPKAAQDVRKSDYRTTFLSGLHGVASTAAPLRREGGPSVMEHMLLWPRAHEGGTSTTGTTGALQQR